ncbi:glycoside hydrolase family 20 zincin-like fold domain-containing protein [Flavobacterium sp. LC2016-01]|uniref:glycoside hydrolase family 20 zincin-like fold domain-containing protein n=1 Tax=Flavobacterium sp. LC2016-01 TaxID=2675876 RepID=UPI001E625D7E|nr:glycoside hydrolase family 20 zincin-like fold domain-containing protein [Flavobacterium sp. LC2016-01]
MTIKIFSIKESKTAEILESAFNFKTDSKKSNSKVEFITDVNFKSKEAYKISISSKKIIVTGSEEGLFYAVQSLLQLLPNKPSDKKEIKLPFITVEDAPR